VVSEITRTTDLRNKIDKMDICHFTSLFILLVGKRRMEPRGRVVVETVSVEVRRTEGSFDCVPVDR
jgi:hypothetical protein